jgi:predicted ester cyclase
MSTGKDNEAAVRACFENASAGNFGALHEILSSDYVLHPEEVRGVDGLSALVQGYRDAFSGLNVTVEHQFSSGEWVATRTTMRGRHDGQLMGAPPSGREVEFTTLTISRCHDGRIEEEWEIADVGTLLAQIRALPEPATA